MYFIFLGTSSWVQSTQPSWQGWKGSFSNGLQCIFVKTIPLTPQRPLLWHSCRGRHKFKLRVHTEWVMHPKISLFAIWSLGLGLFMLQYFPCNAKVAKHVYISCPKHILMWNITSDIMYRINHTQKRLTRVNISANHINTLHFWFSVPLSQLITVNVAFLFHFPLTDTTCEWHHRLSTKQETVIQDK